MLDVSTSAIRACLVLIFIHKHSTRQSISTQQHDTARAVTDIRDTHTHTHPGQGN